MLCVIDIVIILRAFDTNTGRTNTPQSAIKFESPTAPDDKPSVVVKSETKVDQPNCRQLAWDQLMDDKSWIAASEKEQVLSDTFGLSGWEDLSFLTPTEIENLMGKLKTVPARKFEGYMSSAM